MTTEPRDAARDLAAMLIAYAPGGRVGQLCPASLAALALRDLLAVLGMAGRGEIDAGVVRQAMTETSARHRAVHPNVH